VRRGSPPLQMGQKLWGRLGRRPAATSQCRSAMADRQIDPFDESGVQPSREAEFLQGGLKSGLCPQAHHVRHPNQLAPPGALLHLAVNQARRHLPSAHVAPSTTQREPLANVGCEGREVQIEAIAGEEREACRSQVLSQGGDEQVRGMVCTWTKMEHGNKLGARIDGEPEPQHLFSAAVCAVRPPAGAGGADGRRSARAGCARASPHATERLGMVACRKPCDPLGSRRIQPFGQRVIRTTATRHGKAFSDDTRECCAEL
jgi:hypothetical protein